MAIAPATLDDILADITGGASANQALKSRSIAPAEFYRTLDADADLLEKYARAKSAGLEVHADLLLEISDEEPPRACGAGEFPGDAKVDAGWVAWQRNRVDTRKWLLSKLQPKKYGDKTTVDANLSGSVAITIKDA
jgi:hypothetical protein